VRSLLQVKAEHEKYVEPMRLKINDVQKRFRTDVVQFEKRYVKTRVLLDQQKTIEHMLHHGELLDLDASPLVAEINQELSSMVVVPIRERIINMVPSLFRKTIERTQEKANERVSRRRESVGRLRGSLDCPPPQKSRISENSLASPAQMAFTAAHTEPAHRHGGTKHLQAPTTPEEAKQLNANAAAMMGGSAQNRPGRSWSCQDELNQTNERATGIEKPPSFKKRRSDEAAGNSGGDTSDNPLAA